MYDGEMRIFGTSTIPRGAADLARLALSGDLQVALLAIHLPTLLTTTGIWRTCLLSRGTFDHWVPRWSRCRWRTGRMWRSECCPPPRGSPGEPRETYPDRHRHSIRRTWQYWCWSTYSHGGGAGGEHKIERGREETTKDSAYAKTVKEYSEEFCCSSWPGLVPIGQECQQAHPS